MIMYGIDYIIILIVVECDYFGLQWVLVLDVWYFYVKVRVMMMIGMMISSISMVVVISSVFLLWLIWFLGLRMVELQFVRNMDNVNSRFGCKKCLRGFNGIIG